MAVLFRSPKRDYLVPESNYTITKGTPIWIPIHAIGLRFGMMQARVGLATMLQNFEFQFVPKLACQKIYHVTRKWKFQAISYKKRF